ncbi:MAG: hypothetical protein ACI8P0_005510 [Planctomycetaceae bacterium]|jgi:hypothetical protein
MVPGYDPGQARTELAGLTKPDPKERAAQIVAWAICWPWNLVWTLCVYNPFRYVGEFLLREIQSALFEISNGQFRSIERDLTLEPLPPPYPIPERRAHYENIAAQTTSVEATIETPLGVTVNADPAAPQIEAERTTENPASDHSTTIETSTTVAAADQAEPISDQQPDEPTIAAEASNERSVEDIPAEVEAELLEGGSSDSYTWEPPEPTAYVPLSDRPLKAVKYDTGSILPPTPGKQTAPTEPAADPWFEKKTPNR